MCRLTAYIGAPLRVAECLFEGTHSLYRQSWEPREMLRGTVNADGWGVVWYMDDVPVRLARPEPIWHATDLEAVVSTIQAPSVMAALRSATPGLSIGADGVPPFVHGPWSFTLNGFIPDFRSTHMRRMRARLPDHLYASLVGSSDAETVFMMVVDQLEQGASPAAALADVASSVLSDVGGAECQLTMALSGASTLAYVRTSNRDSANSLYRLDRGPRSPEGIMVASEALDDGGWSAVPAHVAIEIDRGGASSEIVLR